MYDALRLASVLALMVFLLRRKAKIGNVMLAGSGLLAALYLMGPEALLRTAVSAAANGVTIKLLLALSFIRALELILRERGVMAGMMESARSIFKSRRAVIVSMPLLIGMIPSVGGAYFSAPMVEESSKGLSMSGEEKGFVNYWFRHPWEFVLPLYPGLLLASAVSGVRLRDLMLANLGCAAAMVVLGFAFSMRGAGVAPRGGGGPVKGLSSFVPVGAVLALVIIAGLELYVSILAVTAALALRYRFGAGGLWRLARHGFSLEVLVLIYGVMLFKGVMEASGAVGSLSGHLSALGIPLALLLVSLPFCAGLLTGLTIGFVGATFPLIASLDGGGSLAAVSLAFASGFVGVLLSPVHVCLVLTGEYFRADLAGIYRRMALPSGAVMLVALAGYFVLG